jgi:hypothetical protein
MDKNAIISVFNATEGWFYGDEGQFLLESVERALREAPSKTVVEVGSYLGKSTTLLGWAAQKVGATVYAVDPHEGEVTQPGGATMKLAPTFDRFQQNMTKAGLSNTVKAVRQKSCDIQWAEQIGFLFIDGMHDYGHVAVDYSQFASWVPEGGFIGFHDYNPMWPDVMRCVNERIAAGSLVKEKLVNSLLLTQKRTGIGFL